ncbi:hypothetical protein PM082_006161 [Marasmius tenuissimus]|nr:hypothetical protein PM082_006161 [Marasmius tenuissimus]
MILEGKKSKRVEALKEAEAEQTVERRRCQAERQRVSRTDDASKNLLVDNSEKQRSCLFQESLKSIELTLDGLKQRFLKVIRPTRCQYFDKLCMQIEQWIEDSNQFRRTIHCASLQSPLILAIKYIESALEEYESIKDKYFYVMRDKEGPKWDWKRDDCKAFKDIAGEVLQALRDIELALENKEFEERAIDGELLYQEVFPY